MKNKVSPKIIRTLRESSWQRLITKDVLKKFEKYPISSQDGKGMDAKVLVKFFGGPAATWLITEGSPTEDGDYELFGYVTLDGYEWEWGYVMLSELQSLRFPPFGLPIERDMYEVDNNTTVKDLVK